MVEKDRRTGHVYAEQDEEVLLRKKKRLRSTSMLFLSGSVIVLENPNCKIYDGLTWYKSVILEVYDGTTLTKMLCWIRWLIQMMFLVDDGFRLTSRLKHEFFPILGY